MKNLGSFFSLCSVAIVSVIVYYVDFFVSFVLRHWWMLQVLTPRMSRNFAQFNHSQ